MSHQPDWNGPDFFIIGAAKAGTTAVWTWLRNHPEIYLPDVKEPGYFAYYGHSAIPANGPYDRDYVAQISTDWASYRALYPSTTPRLCGDVSPVYAAQPVALARISAHRPDARIIFLLRNPAERAFSQYLHHRRDGLEPLPTFEQALAAENRRTELGWSWAHRYADGSDYLPKVKTLLSHFPYEQTLFIDFAEIESDPEACWKKICAHIGVSVIPMPENQRVNVTQSLEGLPSRQFIERILRHPGRVQQKLKYLIHPAIRQRIRKTIAGRTEPLPELDPTTRAQMTAHLNNKNAELAELTGLHF